MKNQEIKQVTFVRDTYGNYNEQVFYIEIEGQDPNRFVYHQDFDELLHQFLDKGYEIKIVNRK